MYLCIFGGGSDICIVNSANENYNSYSNFGFSYSCDPMIYTSD